MKDAKYLIAYIGPLSTFLGLYFGGIWSLGIFYIGFGIIPLIEIFMPGNTLNFTPEQEENKLKSRFFDWMLYLNVPIMYALIVYYYSILQAGGLTNFEYIAMTINIGLTTGIIGINVGHELGHRSKKYEQFLSKLLLIPSMYMHFFIEHNRGHHKNVATDKDPASSRLNENFYAFLFRTITGSYISAWRLENQRLRRAGKAIISIENEMIRFQFVQLAYLLTIGLVIGWYAIPLALVSAVFGLLMLESVNYIEHYGLRRKKLPSGRYENVGPEHSWNCNHEMGRIFLYELTRHSDHHYKANRKYQVLRHFKESPQLPFGYPAAVILATIPPLWFKVMNKKVAEYSK